MSFFITQASLDWLDDIMLSRLQLRKAFEMKEKQNEDVYSDPKHLKIEFKVWIVPTIAAGNRIKNDGLYFFSLSSGEGRGLGEVCLDFLGNRGISTTLNWSLSGSLALATHSFYLHVIHNNLNLRRLYMNCTRRHLGDKMKHFKLGMDINSTHGKQRVQKKGEAYVR